MGDLPRLQLPAVGVLVVGYTDTILTARSFARRAGGGADNDAKDNVDNNQELLALVAANLGAAAFPRFPGQRQRQPDRPRRGRW